MQYSSAYDVIKSGYDPALDKGNWCWHGAYWEACQQMPLSQFETKNLLDKHTTLYFTKLPETPGEYNFTVQYHFGIDPVTGKEGRIASGEIKAVFTEADHVAMPVHGEPLVPIEPSSAAE